MRLIGVRISARIIREEGMERLLIYRRSGVAIFRQDPHSVPGGLSPLLNKARNAVNDK